MLTSLYLLLLIGLRLIEGKCTTHIFRIGTERTPIAVLDDVLPGSSYLELRDRLRANAEAFLEGEENGVSFPGKIAALDAADVDPLVDAILASEQATAIFPPEIFRQREYVRGFASILCHEGWVHSDYANSKFEGVVQPAAVFYFGFDGANSEYDNTTGTSFYREVETGIERVRDIRDWSDTHYEGAFEETHVVFAKPNRMSLYSQDLLHNAWVKEGMSLPCSALKGRLAISLFFLAVSGAREISRVDSWRQEAGHALAAGGAVDDDDDEGACSLTVGDSDATPRTAWKPCADDDEQLMLFPKKEIQEDSEDDTGDDTKPNVCKDVKNMGACTWSHSGSPVLYPWRGCCPRSCGVCDETNTGEWSRIDATQVQPTTLLTSFDPWHRRQFVRRHPAASTAPLYELARSILLYPKTISSSRLKSFEAYAHMEMRRASLVGLNRPCWLRSCPKDPSIREAFRAQSRQQPGLHERSPVNSVDLREVCPWLSDLETTGIWFSGQDTHTSWNVESLNMTAAHTVLIGSEIWALLPPDVVPPMMKDHSFRVDPEAMDPSRFVVHPKSWRDRSAQLKEALRYQEARIFEVTAGETVVVPSGWWMTWYNTAPTIALHDALVTSESLGGTLGELRLGFERCRRMLESKVRGMGDGWMAAVDRSEEPVKKK